MTNSTPDNPIAPNARWTALTLLSIAELLGMSLWFSASAVVPALRSEWNLSESNASWLTIAVQLGFVLGTLLSALLNLPDIINVRTLFAISAFAGALTNAAFGFYARGPQAGIPLRFFTGLFLAGVYPPGMKIMATWFRERRGMALGVLVGALTLAFSPSLGADPRRQFWMALIWVAALLVFSVSRVYALSLITLFVAGYCQISFVAAANNRIQTITPDHLRGRVMALYAQALIGVGPIGSLQAGALATFLGAPGAMAIGAVVAGVVIVAIRLIRPEVFAPS